MVISLSDDTAYNHFQENGYVVTFRANRRKNRYTDTWLNRGRGKEKICDVHVAEICEISDGIGLEKFANLSGFGRVYDWKVAIKRLNNKEVPSNGYLYLVTKKNGDQ